MTTQRVIRFMTNTKPRVRVKDGKPSVQCIQARLPNKTLVNCLTDLLRKAEAGEVISMVYACGWHGDWMSSGAVTDGRTRTFALLGQTHLAVREYEDWLRGKLSE